MIRGHLIYIELRIFFNMLNFINPVQLPLHEPYFDLTLIRTIHTKIPTIASKSNIFTNEIIRKQNYCTYSFQHATSG